jgi:Protein of unknown function (DUF3489)
MLHSKTRSKTEPARGQIRANGPTKLRRVAASTRSGTKQEAVLGMLRRPNGASIAAIMETTGWQKHSVRGFLSGVVRKRLKLNLGSQTVDGIQVYQLTGSGTGKASSKRPSDNRTA